MRFEIVNPSKALVLDASEEELKTLASDLTYTNTSAQHLVKRHSKNFRWKQSAPEAWRNRLDELKADVKKTLLFYDENGVPFIRPGSISYLPPYDVTNKIKYPTPKKVPWAKKLPFEFYPYQDMSFEKLLAERHGNVELCTGAGKSAILLKLCRETGFNTAIVAPSKSIFLELVEKFELFLGKGNVGTFGNGKKKLGKRFTVCIGDSIANIQQGTEEWQFFSNLDMMVVDESHTWGADSLEAICHGVLANIPYRFFLSGTQTRGDGAEKLLQSIIGRTVHTLTTREAIAGGYICTHDFNIVRLESSNPNYNSSEILEMKRAHFLNNRNIAAFAAKLANSTAKAFGHQTLILVEELNQIVMLLHLLQVPFAYAHSESSKAKLELLGLQKVDSAESVEKFNKNEIKVLVGTSCIATGTNIYPSHTVINWVGGSSEIKTKQGPVGRAVRLHNQNPFKDKCVEKKIAHIYDFDVYDVPVLHRQLEDRLAYYADSGTEIKRITLK